MYAADVTEAAVARADTARREYALVHNKPPPAPLKYHNRTQIDHAIDHLDDLWDPERKVLKRPLKPDEYAFIQNERTLCALDFRGYWAKHYCWIVDWRKQELRFSPNVAQEIVMDLWADRERKQLAIWMQQLKARRLGVSTVSELGVQHRFQFHRNSNCVVASADPGKTTQMAGMIRYNLAKQPWWLLPQGKPKIKDSIPVEYPDINTVLTIEAGNQFNGVARGATPNVVHLSELCEWEGADQLIDAALMRAILDTPMVFGILESTANGIGNWWHKTWEQNKKDFQRGTARTIPLFLPWYVGTDLYPTETDLLARPIPANWIPDDRTIRHAERAREYVLSNPLLFEHLAKFDKEWKMSRAQMWFREIEYQTAKDKKQLNIFLAELCADDFEAFQTSNIPLIDQEILLSYQERTRQPLACYTIIGPEIPPSLVVSRRHWDWTKPSITINTREILPRYDVKFQLVPVKFEGYPTFDEALKLLVWEEPSDHCTYGLGVDTSEGIGQDNAVISVMREATIQRPPGVVAEFAYDYVKAFQLWPIVMTVACYYSVLSQTAGKRTQSKLCIECRGNGEACQHELQKRGWANFHLWKRYDNKIQTKDEDTRKIGIYTNHWFRAQMMDMILTAIDEEAIDLPSPYLVQELMTLEREEDVQKAKAAYGAKDDRVMAMGFPLFSLHVAKPASKQFARRRIDYAPGLIEDPGRAEPIWTPPSYGVAQHPMIPSVAQVAQHIQLSGTGRYVGLHRITNRDLPDGYK